MAYYLELFKVQMSCQHLEFCHKNSDSTCSTVHLDTLGMIHDFRLQKSQLANAQRMKSKTPEKQGGYG
jgi:hypothetical protein